MTLLCKTNEWVINGNSIFIQVIFTVTFIIVFFFIYVSKMEKEKFKSQMNLIIDNIIKDSGIKDSRMKNVILNCILEQKINKNNQNYIVKNALKYISILFIIMIIISILLLLIGFCIPLINQIKKAIIIVIFTGITEIVFYYVITTNYISINPNKVTCSFYQAVQNWIKVNRK